MEYSFEQRNTICGINCVYVIKNIITHKKYTGVQDVIRDLMKIQVKCLLGIAIMKSIKKSFDYERSKNFQQSKYQKLLVFPLVVSIEY